MVDRPQANQLLQGLLVALSMLLENVLLPALACLFDREQVKFPATPVLSNDNYSLLQRQCPILGCASKAHNRPGEWPIELHGGTDIGHRRPRVATSAASAMKDLGRVPRRDGWHKQGARASEMPKTGLGVECVNRVMPSP